jgi:hypothetical protein
MGQLQLETKLQNIVGTLKSFDITMQFEIKWSQESFSETGEQISI